ncbi:glycoside hydrolase family 43 protein [Microbulbifer sp.]|uniref:glycoside hydrolase family 43 protein n=1 Tax=Microbulbifer sp. TaxID=1908541 RepID=UPI003F34B59D
MRLRWLFPTALLLAAAQVVAVPRAVEPVAFDWFEYRGMDPLFEGVLAKGEYQNPVAAGFFPDPSIARRGDDYYMAHSSFAYVPGLPILHSRDLVNWRLLGHALTRRSQVDMRGLQVSQGIFAPTLRYHQGRFYLIGTAVGAGGNFLITAKDPQGPWSDPVWLPEIGGIDPDIFFDDDGRVFIAHNDVPEGEPLYDGHRAIWLWEYDPEAERVLPDSGRVIVNGGVDLSEEPVWIEGPHLYKVNGWYYLLCAEGGTGYNHSEVVFRTRKLDEPFEPYSGNPILTQRDLERGRADPIVAAGHADLVQTPEGDWWSVFLATRPYDEVFYNTGRETFLLPVSWKDGWPRILAAGQAIPQRLDAPAIDAAPAEGAPLTGNFTWRDDFETRELNPQWNLLRGDFERDWLQLRGKQLQLLPKPRSMASQEQPVYLGRRQQHQRFQTSAQLRLPADEDVSAGIVAFQNENHHYYLGVKAAGKDGYEIFLERAAGGEPQRLHSVSVDAKAGEAIALEIRGDRSEISFYYQPSGRPAKKLVAGMDGKLLSTEVAGGFVGTTLGPHARSESP